MNPRELPFCCPFPTAFTSRPGRGEPSSWAASLKLLAGDAACSLRTLRQAEALKVQGVLWLVARGVWTAP